MKKIKVWINGKLIDADKAKISVFDRGFLYGDGVFETMRSYAGVVFKLDRHLNRLFASLRVIKIDPPCGKTYFKEAVCKLLRTNGLKSAYIRLAVTRGEGGFGIGYPRSKDDFSPNIVIVAREFRGYPEWMHKRGISAKVVRARQNEYSPLSGIKSMNYLNYILARFHAKENGCDEAILTNTKGYVTEGATSNIFLVKDDGLITPSLDSGILPGITREVIIEIARRLRLKVSERKVLPSELPKTDEIFLTNSLAEVLPVIKIGPKRVGRGVPGDITKLLRISYQKQVIREVLR